MNKVLLITLLLLGGCATTGNYNHKYTSQYSEETLQHVESGVIVGSIARDPNTHRYDVQSFYFENQETKEKYRLELSPADGGIDTRNKLKRFNHFSTVEGAGDVFNFTLPVGKYHFYNFYLKQGPKSWTAKDDYSVPFEVNAGEVKYIGQIKQIPLFGGKFLGINVRDYAGSLWLISDEVDRDKAVLKQQYPDVNLKNLIVSVPDYEAVPNDIIVTPSEAVNLEYAIDSFTDGIVDTFSMREVVCGAPFNFTQSCNGFFGSSKKIQINDAKMRIAGSDDGKSVMVMKSSVLTLAFTSAGKTLDEIRQVLSENSISVLNVKAIKYSNNLEGYIISLDGDGYSVLKNYER